ncbi:hypothetical protein TGAMA5MH_06831 [Trichoderma gamsii]|uniref:Uncharacterized protein n=1 Tax=Trichoderma gamsii TaxID=398673 RepID=A0A2K0T616_9HYPO|nr:hypothetical protein TGAMA5MH_06831 [Trichoderma gamsii]
MDIHSVITLLSGFRPREAKLSLEESEEEDDDDNTPDAQEIRRGKDRPYICNDHWGSNAERIDFSMLYVSREVTLTELEGVAQHLSRFDEAVPEEAGCAVSLIPNT